MRVLVLALLVALCTAERWTVVQSGGKLHVRRGSGGLADAEVVDQRERNGWIKLDVATPVRDAAHLTAAGYLEGVLHQRLIFAAFVNFANATSATGAVVPPKAATLISAQDAWLRKQVASFPSSAYWREIGLLLAHYDGIVQGYQSVAPHSEKLSTFDLLVYALQEELPDYVAAAGETQVFHETFNGKRFRFFGSKCSVLVKLTPKHLLASHDTWYDFNSMLRVFKFYHFGSQKVAFSSYPGLPVSGDDYVLNQNGLFITETTLNIFNQSLYNNFFKAQSVPYWLRVQVANSAKTAPEWHQLFSQYNNGGYNNEWIILDYKLFEPGTALRPNTMVVGEQLPGFYKFADLTNVLQNATYWASYNVPYFPEIYRLSGNEEMYEKYGNAYSWTLCPRAQVYRRDHSSVTDLEGLKRLQRSNHWQTDPLSLGSAAGQVSARADLNSPYLGHTFAPFGGLDCKAADETMVMKMETDAVCGPTFDSQPIFHWNDQYDNYPSLEMPRVFNFQFVRFKPTL